MRSFLSQTLRLRDHDRYLCCLFAPASKRETLLTILALNAELASIPPAVSDATIGAIKLAWWKEALAHLTPDNTSQAHPLLQQIPSTHLCDNLAELVEYSSQLAEGRAMELGLAQGFASADAFETYLNHTAIALHRWFARTLDADAAETHALTIHASARCYGIIGQLRATVHDANRGIIRWPRDVMAQCGMAPSAIAHGTEAEALRRFVQHWVAQVQQEDQTIRIAMKLWPRSLNMLRLLHEVTMIYAQLIEKNAYELTRLTTHLPGMAWRLWWKSCGGNTSR